MSSATDSRRIHDLEEKIRALSIGGGVTHRKMTLNRLGNGGPIQEAHVEERTILDPARVVAEQRDVDALKAEIGELKTRLATIESAQLTTLHALTTLSSLPRTVDAQGIQLLEGLEMLAQLLGVRNLAQLLNIEKRSA
jgi:hypothetical protein